MDLKRSKKLKRIVSGMLSPAMITSMSAVLPASANADVKTTNLILSGGFKHEK